jgi:hypothetical protein
MDQGPRSGGKGRGHFFINTLVLCPSKMTEHLPIDDFMNACPKNIRNRAIRADRFLINRSRNDHALLS